MQCHGCKREIGAYAENYCPFCGCQLAGAVGQASRSEEPLTLVPPGSSYEAPTQGQPLQYGRPLEDAGPPWERKGWPFIERVLATVKESLFKPTEFFENMRIAGGYSMPLFYALLVGGVGRYIAVNGQLALQSLAFAGRGFENYAIFLAYLAAMLVVIPVSIIAHLFIGAGVTQLLLMLFRGAHRDFEATFRVVSYSFAPQILLIIPFCIGLLATLVYMSVLQIIGLRRVHRNEYWQSALAVIISQAIPLAFLFCGCGMGFSPFGSIAPLFFLL